jgi:hypothetical protein
MDDELAAGMVVVCLSQQPLDIRAMQRLSQRKAANILMIIGPSYQRLMLIRAQHNQRLHIEHNMHSILHTEARTIPIQRIRP